jgi:hypothetical protein
LQKIGSLFNCTDLSQPFTATTEKIVVGFALKFKGRNANIFLQTGCPAPAGILKNLEVI